MNIFLRITTFLLILLSLAGCQTTNTRESAAFKYANCPACPFDPCDNGCPRPRDCGPTVKQLNRISMKEPCIGGANARQELEKHDVQVIHIGDNVIVLLPTDKIFEFNSLTIREDAYPILNYLACFLHSYRCVPLRITVHTDNVASRCFNDLISDKRALTIQAYLWIRGIHFKVMRASGCGNAAPIANQTTVAGNASNRRIEIRIRRTC